MYPPFFKLTNNVYFSCFTWNSTFFHNLTKKKHVCISPLNVDDDYGFISSFILGLEKNLPFTFFFGCHLIHYMFHCHLIHYMFPLLNLLAKSFSLFFSMRSLLSRNCAFVQLFQSFAVLPTNEWSPKHKPK